MRDAGKNKSSEMKETDAQGARWLSEGICDSKSRPQESGLWGELQGTLLSPRICSFGPEQERAPQKFSWSHRAAS